MLTKILKRAALSFLVTGSVALGLIASQQAKLLPEREGLNFTTAFAQDLSQAPETQAITMRDGSTLAVREYGAQSDGPLVIMLHGSGFHGLQFDGLATKLADHAHVLAPDLRGHGVAPERRGDVDYIGQLEDDLADLIKAKAKPNQKVVMLGHSSGGGLVVRFAGGAHGDMIDHAILLAPFLKHNAPTTRQDAGGWAYVLTRRIIGLSILNAFKITALNYLPIIQFNFPQRALEGPYGETVTAAYSYRLNTSYAPRSDYMKDIAALPTFSLISGREDEAFFATEYEPLMTQATGKGRYLLLDDTEHFGVVYAPETLVAIKEDLSGL
jgi:pimeloyl-ACP methyl ester carboxylesterase|tara:strand:+ start:1723 stop:2700 length:978 start_codon:yes stop_codon:yes gene_type:complete